MYSEKRTNLLEQKKLFGRMQINYTLIAFILPIVLIVTNSIHTFFCLKYSFQNDPIKIESYKNGIVLLQIINRLKELEAKVDKVIII
jgi:hypothetical protein